MAAISVNVPSNDAIKPVSTVERTAGSSGNLVEFSISLPLSPVASPAAPQAAAQRSSERSAQS
jgi:hypothetical protein